ncbi:MAG: DUF1294 domain-containing protein [Desulfobulbus sp.]|nr:DUF1294 domain-containing protein [Desulfobulbus sp.]
MRVKGKVIKWKNDKGFGFIKPTKGMADIFFHENFLLNQSRRPTIGEEVSFEIATNPEGKQRAERILFRGERDPRQRDIFFDVFFSGVSIAFFIGIGTLVFLKKLDPIVLILYLAVSLITFSLYRHDKIKAQNDQRRTPEKDLHFFSLIGGWPGALIAQRALHHKSRKKSFLATFYITVIINIIVLSLYCFSGANFLNSDKFFKEINQITHKFSQNSRDKPSQRPKGPVYSWINKDGEKKYSNVGFPENEPCRDRRIDWK